MDDRLEPGAESENGSNWSTFRTVIIHRGDKGYGLTVSGDCPVTVQEVKDGGPAAQAGVKKGDSIIKVNGTQVSQSNHKEVVHIIKSAQCVKLTLQSRPESAIIDPGAAHQIADPVLRPLPPPPSSKTSDRITAPLPADMMVRNQMEHNKARTLQTYLEKQKTMKENIIFELQNGPNTTELQKRLQKRLENVDAQIHKISEQLKSMDDTQSSSSASDSGSRPSSHCRNKSSPDPLGIQNSPVSNRLSDTDSFSGSGILANHSKVAAVSEDEPPGTPPPPYSGLTTTLSHNPEDNDNYSIINEENNFNFDKSFSSINTDNIISFEDEDFPDHEPVVDHGPFQSFNRLCSNNAYLAVFVNYAMSNCDSSSLFFYMISDLYKEGGVKEMKKWAYEIHSCFLVPTAPMKLPNIDDKILNEIEQVLQNELDKEEILKRVFWKARMKSREDINEQLADFRNKRNAGLGTLFGPQDHILEESIHNKAKELSIVEGLLVPCLDSISEDLRNTTDHQLIMASSLATILWKFFNVKAPLAQQLIDKCPLFVNKDRPLRNKLFKGNKKHVVRDHTFNPSTYYRLTYCNHCLLIIWGIAPQGFQCINCEMNVHKSCVQQVEEPCIGQLNNSKGRRDTKFGNLLNRIKNDDKDKYKKISTSHQGYKDLEDEFSGSHVIRAEEYTGDKNNVSGTSGGKEQRRSDPGSAALPNNHSNHLGASNDDDHSHGSADHPDHSNAEASPSSSHLADSPSSAKFSNLHKKKSSAINRSESCKEKAFVRKQTRDNNRKNSDPNLPTSKRNDVDGDSALHYNSVSSSNSDLSQSQESPSSSLDPVHRPESSQLTTAFDNDSDIEVELNLPDWKKQISQEKFDNLDSRDRKRQETINELFHTEQTHVRVLKVLKHLFYSQMQDLVNNELLSMLFPNLDQILDCHIALNQAMKRRRAEEPLVKNVGDILVQHFDGEQGMQFQEVVATFVAPQSIALEKLKNKLKKDQRLANFLQEQENNSHCRRLQLKDMLPAAFQRFAKYPLLLESLLSYTDEVKQSEEYEQINRSLERSKEILAYINTKVQEEDSNHRLSEIQKRLDQSALAKNKSGCDELRGHLDLTKHKLIHEGPLTWRTKGPKNIDLHVLILEDSIVLLQKENDKYILKYHCLKNDKNNKEDNKFNHPPILKLGTFIFRAVAVDKCAFFIVLTQSALGAQIYELVAMSPNERKVWFRHFHEADVAYSATREGRNRRPTTQPPLMPDSEDTNTTSTTEEQNPSIPPTVPDTLRDGAEETTEGDNAEGGTDTGDSSKGKATSPIPSSPETLSKKTETLRRKDQRIRAELQEKQHLIEDILNIPRDHFETVADMAGDASLGNKEPKELVLAAIYQAKCLQDTINKALNVKESDIVAAKSNGDATNIPLYQTNMNKLMSISGSLSQQLACLLNLVSERDEERDRMRKELVASRERLHLLHMRNNSSSTSTALPVTVTGAGAELPPSTSSPTTSRPNSYISISSSAAEQSDNPDQSDEARISSTDASSSSSKSMQ